MTRTTITTAAGKTTPTYGYLLNNDTVETLIEMVNEHASALDTAGVPPGTLGYETKTSGALTLTMGKSYVSVTNTVAFTLADGTATGQTKSIECSAISGTPVGTLTVATMDTVGGGVGATFVFTAVGQAIDLEWNGTAWHMVRKTRAGRQAAVVGTKVLQGAADHAGYCLAAAYDLSVTATVHSTGTKGIPNGQVPGERIHIDCTTAASSPIGDIAITATTLAGASATSLANLTDTTVSLDLLWTGLTWQATQFTAGTGTATLS